MIKHLLTVIALLGVVSLAQAQTAGLAFLRIGANASAGAMGDAQVAHSEDAFSTYWNPAGLAAATSNSVALSHHIWIADTRSYSIASRFRSGNKGGVGLFLTAFDSGEFDARDRPGPAAGTFSAQFVSLGASYGRSFGPVRLGTTVKYLSESIDSDNASGYAFDFGMQAEFFKRGIRIGAALQNVGEMTELNAEASELPQRLRAGVSIYPFRVLAMADGIILLNAMLTAEVSHLYPTETTQYHFGAAAEVVELVTVRAGYITNDELRGITFGGGLESNGFQFDYAFMPFENGFPGPGHLLTLLYVW